MAKACRFCDASFEPTNNRQQYCGQCERRPLAVCIVCQKEFRAARHSSGRYCSRACFHATVSVPERNRKPCAACGKEFKPATAKSKTCSRACAGRIQQRPDATCRACGKQFHGGPTQATCSYECAGALRRKHPQFACERCGEPMEWKKTMPVRFCSKKCRALPAGAQRRNNTGYMEIKTTNGAWRLEHRVVMEEKLGRPLAPRENVHHINGQRDDNRPENLELWTRSQPSGVRAADYHCPGCTCHVTVMA